MKYINININIKKQKKNGIFINLKYLLSNKEN